MMRVREGLAVNSVDPFSSPLKEELKTAKFTVLPSKDPNGAALAVFNARLHDPSVSCHKLTLQGNQQFSSIIPIPHLTFTALALSMSTPVNFNFHYLFKV